ncbi:MAG: O-antigen ligase family protein [Campylobacterales bacterium]
MSIISTHYQYLHWLIIALSFSIPISVAISNIFVGFIILYLLIEGNIKQRIIDSFHHPLGLAIWIFVGWQMVTILWTSGYVNVFKNSYLLLIPFLLTTIKKETIRPALLSFVMAMTISEIISYGIFFELFNFKDRTPDDPTPFMTHIQYNPLLAFSILLLIVMFFQEHQSMRAKIYYAFFATTMTINMFITGGRAGQVVFFILMTLAALYFLRKHFLKLMAFLILLPIVFITAYQTSNLFHQRVNLVFEDIQKFPHDPETSVGRRIFFAQQSLKLIKEAPIFGHGQGSFPGEYARLSSNSPFLTVRTCAQPHNQYLLIAVQNGLIGVILFLNIFIQQMRLFLKAPESEWRIFQLALPVMFMIICLSDSYIYGHATQLFFVLFSSLLYHRSLIAPKV